jgi:tetratricopeptide (TPR) repeat protein
LARRIRTTRKKLAKKPDEFISLWARIVDYLYGHQIFFYVAFSTVIVLCVGIVALSFFLFHRQAKADVDLWKAVVLYETAGASESDLEKALDAFSDVSKKYPFSKAKKIALLYEGNVLYDLKRYDEALDAYKAAERRISGPLDDMIRHDIGYTLEKMQRYDDAAATFLALLSPEDKTTYLDLIRNYEKAGKKDEVKKYGEEYLTLFPDSLRAPAIKEQIEKSGGK